MTPGDKPNHTEAPTALEPAGLSSLREEADVKFIIKPHPRGAEVIAVRNNYRPQLDEAEVDGSGLDLTVAGQGRVISTAHPLTPLLPDVSRAEAVIRMVAPKVALLVREGTPNLLARLNVVTRHEAHRLDPSDDRIAPYLRRRIEEHVLRTCWELPWDRKKDGHTLKGAGR